MIRKSRDYETFVNSRNNRNDLVGLYNSLLKNREVGLMSFSAFIQDIVPAYAKLASLKKLKGLFSDQHLYEKFASLGIKNSHYSSNASALLKADELVEDQLDDIQDW